MDNIACTVPDFPAFRVQTEVSPYPARMGNPLSLIFYPTLNNQPRLPPICLLPEVLPIYLHNTEFQSKRPLRTKEFASV